MKEIILNKVWSLGVRLRQFVKRYRFFRYMDTIMLKLAPFIVPPPSDETEISLPSGFRMIIPCGFPSARSFIIGNYEKDVVDTLLKIIKKGDSVAVVGANVGYHPLISSCLVGQEGKVFAFEPDPKNYSYLEKNVLKNKCTNIITEQKAVSRYSGNGLFSRDKYGVEGSLKENPLDNSISVETTSLDDYFCKIGWPKLDVIILDVEGAEADVMKGMQNVCKKNPQIQLIVEIHNKMIHQNGESLDTVTNALLDLGFMQGNIIGQTLKPFSLSHGLPEGRNTYDIVFSND